MATETEAAVEGAVHAAEEAVGMPQLDFTTYANQIFWLIVALVAIYILMSRFALPRIAAVLAERQDTIAGDIAAAEELKRQAEQAEKAYNQAIVDARAEAGKIVAAAKAAIQKDLDAATAKADAEIAARAAESERRIAEIRAGALASVKDVAVEAAAEIVALLGSKGDAKAVADAVAERMKG
jgi:F-type H+-transporting ATPase subunit b